MVTFQKQQEIRFPKIHRGSQVSGSKWPVVKCPNCHPSHKDIQYPVMPKSISPVHHPVSLVMLSPSQAAICPFLCHTHFFSFGKLFSLQINNAHYTSTWLAVVTVGLSCCWCSPLVLDLTISASLERLEILQKWGLPCFRSFLAHAKAAVRRISGHNTNFGISSHVYDIQ